MASIMEQSKKIKLDPSPGFVVKTKILESSKPNVRLITTKVFINICHDKQVPKPKQDFDPAVVFTLIINNKWEIPIIVSEEKIGTDKKGQNSFIYDCCINSTCFQWCQVNSDLRSILIEWCLEAIELLYEVTLEREYSIPKMLSKGELSGTIISESELDESGFQKKLQSLKNNETMGLIEEIRNDDELMEEDDELPSLTNIGGAKSTKKPLIEEISDMKITEVPEKKLKKEPVASQKLLSTTPEKYNFTLKFKKLESDYQLLITINSSQFVPSTLNTRLDMNSADLVILNSNQNFYFSTSSPNTLQIPLPIKPSSLQNSNPKAFFATTDNTLYVYV